MRNRSLSVFTLVCLLMTSTTAPGDEPMPTVQTPESIRAFITDHCLQCHDAKRKQGGLDLSADEFDLSETVHVSHWAKIRDRVRDGEMPPKSELTQDEVQPFVDAISKQLVDADRRRAAREGRSIVRRLNRLEYENSLRELLQAPYLLVADKLPADGLADLFNKSSRALDVSHVQMEKYSLIGEAALRTAVNAAAHRSETHRYHARQEEYLLRYLNAPPIRAALPLIGVEVQKAIILGKQAKTAHGKPEIQDQEAMAIFVGSRSDATRADFTKMDPPIAGRYIVRMKSYTVEAGANGYSGGKGFEKTGRQEAYYPDKRDIRRSQRDEPITLYALKESGDSRWLTTFDSHPEPNVIEREVILEEGDNIRADPSRLVRFEADWAGNPNQSANTIPGWAMQWLEVEGPLSDVWPPRSYQAVFGDLPFRVENGEVRVLSKQPAADARRLLSDFAKRAYRGRAVPAESIEGYLKVYESAIAMGYDFTDAMILAFTTVLSSPNFLYLPMNPGQLDEHALAARLSYFLWNGPPDDELLQANLHDPNVLRKQTERLLADERSSRFTAAFLDHWLELREINSTVPDDLLYPEYVTDSLLVESAVLETRTFFQTLLAENLPAENLIDSDFVFVNERLAEHYGLECKPGVGLQRVTLPADSPRGGLLTQASILKVTANGTTTSPVLRGLWITERLLGKEIAPPPSGVEAIEPDTRGTTTIRQQLEKHTQVASCAACHAKFDPVGFALESFDVLGGWRDSYRASGELGTPVAGFGKEGRIIEYRLALPVESQGHLATGETFNDIHELKALLLKDERAIARNLVHQLIVYATGASVSFADQSTVETILDQARHSQYGVRDLIHGIVRSELFLKK